MALSARESGFPALEKYELLEEIGHGGMATVYRARDPRLGREVAVKVIHRHLRENAGVGTRFVAEARAAAKLHHPAIVEVFDVSGEDDRERFIVAELIRGTTLRKVLEQHREMPAEVGACIVLTLCEALEHAHAAAIVHRDIKPENVLVELPGDRAAASGKNGSPSSDPGSGSEPSHLRAIRRGGGDGEEARDSSPRSSDPSDTQASPREPAAPRTPRRTRAGDLEIKARARTEARGVVIKITDFGIAKILDAQGVTSTGQVLGSPAHMAPEQIEGGDIDERTDVFALGVLMYEALVGHLPFEGKNPAQVLRKVLDGTYTPAERDRPKVGGRWSRIIQKAMARDAAERTASPAALGDEIKAELLAAGITDPKAEITTYFADPQAYAAGEPKLVQKILERGEAAKRAGDVQGAASDFNRALALAPQDLSILKRVGSLHASGARRRLLKRAGAIVAGSALLGVGAFGVARAVRGSPAPVDKVPAPNPGLSAIAPADSDSAADFDPAIDGPEGPAPGGSGSASPRKPPRDRVPARPNVVLPPVPSAAATTRNVTFNINPRGAKLAIDGAEQGGWLGNKFALSVGSHQISVKANSECCEAQTRTVVVKAPPTEDKDAPQSETVTLVIKPATVSLAGAPALGQLTCPSLGLIVSPGGSQTVTLKDAEWTGTCEFAIPGKAPKKATVRLSAGKGNPVAWQGE